MYFHKHFGAWESLTLGVLSEGKQLLQLDSDQHFLKIETTVTVKKSRQFARQDLHFSQLSSNDLEVPPLRAGAKLTFSFIIEYWS